MNGERARALRTAERPNPGRKHGGSGKVGVVREPNYSESYADRKARRRSVTGRLNRERIESAAAEVLERMKKAVKR